MSEDKPASGAWKGRLARWSKNGRLLVLVPILALIADLIAFPVLVDRNTDFPSVRIDELLSRQKVVVGTLRGHEVFASLDDVASQLFLMHEPGSRNGLVVSLFRSQGKLVYGSVARTLVERLEKASPAEARSLKAALEAMRGAPVGGAAVHKVNLTEAEYRQFPLAHIHFVVLEYGSKDQPKHLLAGLDAVMKNASRSNTSLLLVPCIGHNWRERSSIEFPTCMEPIIKALGAESQPERVHVSLYNEWPTYVLEEAVGALNKTWGGHVDASFGRFPLPFRGDFRVTLIALALCLWMCSRITALSVRNAAIVAAWFIGLSAGMGAVLDFVTTGYDPALRFALRCGVLVVLALGVRAFVHLSPGVVLPKETRYED